MAEDQLRAHARQIWDAAVAAVRPEDLVFRAATEPGSLTEAIAAARRIIVVGGGKAGAGMSAGLETALADRLDRVSGVVNIPAWLERELRRIRLHVARPAGSNHPTAEGVAGAEEMLRLVAEARAEDLVICLLSGGGSALMPAPAEGITLEDKQSVTRMLHECGATINEMNCVRKHLSRFKGGGLAKASRAGKLFSLIISDVVGNPLDVIASGPTAPDPTTFADALNVLTDYELLDRIPGSIRQRLERGAAGQLPETLKELPASASNVIIGDHILALGAAIEKAKGLGYPVFGVDFHCQSPTEQLVDVFAGVIRRTVEAQTEHWRPPHCLISGGENTVTLPPDHGKGGRNTEFVLALLSKMKPLPENIVILSGGTDGEDGPTDAAGAVASSSTVVRAQEAGLDVADYLRRHDSYTFFSATGDLLKTGLTGTNVMDVRVVLIGA